MFLTFPYATKFMHIPSLMFQVSFKQFDPILCPPRLHSRSPGFPKGFAQLLFCLLEIPKLQNLLAICLIWPSVCELRLCLVYWLLVAL